MKEANPYFMPECGFMDMAVGKKVVFSICKVQADDKRVIWDMVKVSETKTR